MKEWFRGPKSCLERLRESDLIDNPIHFEVGESTQLEIPISIDTRDRTFLTRWELFPAEGELETFDFPVSPLRLNPSPISSFTLFRVPPQSLEMGDANDNENGQGPMRIPLKDHMFPKMTNRASYIVLPPTTGQFELRNALINSLPKFLGGEDENPYAHVRDFDDLMFLQKYRNENEMEAMKLVLFPFSLLGKAKSWLQALRKKSIMSFEMLTKAFYKKFFSLDKTETLRRAILWITQLHGESLKDYLERYKRLILQCLHHGKFTDKDDVEGLDFLEEMAEKLQTWGTMRETDIQEKGGNAFGVGSNSNSEATLTTILHKIESLEMGKNKMSVKTPMQACAACDDVGHYTQDCPLIHEIRETRKDQQFMQMNQQSMSRIETSIAQLASGLSTRDKGTFPSQTQPNPKDETESLHRDEANAVITLRSRKTVDNKVRMPEGKSRKSPYPSHMELIYQICANTGMYRSKDELLEKDAELSNTKVPHGEVTILEDNSWRRGGKLIRSSNFIENHSCRVQESIIGVGFIVVIMAAKSSLGVRMDPP
ncbi:hypothetical protein GIB67_028127 [Kingdonia uniflora]|uniref:CCHC-type domain-containing protein n=1 Tax=Kingdonia uniflora TaxID=39325 RepID=A0A7J7KZP8_9MAGN|nr:hypothetical protein GIB67_028127 [Kingdonia uniflora]